MAIFRPGERHRYHNILKRRKGKRTVTALLSLTAMVDMFTVLVIFLLQNYNATGEILYIPKEVVLPQAQAIKELKPAHVVTISSKEILIEQTPILSFEEVQAQEDFFIQKLADEMKIQLEKKKLEQETKLQNQIRDVVDATRGEAPEDPNAWSKVTIQADKDIDFLTVKKVIYTVVEAGAGEINFAVIKKPKEDSATE